MNSKKYRAFISYARADGEEFAVTLRERLEKDYPDIAVWQDRTGMRGGRDWWDQIRKAIDDAIYLVLVMTPGAMRSTVTRDEWLYARKQGVCVCPVMGVPPGQLDFASLPRWMAKAHFYNLGHEWDSFIGELRSPCTIERVPHMAPELPFRFVERPSEYEPLLDLLLDKDRQNPVAITTALKGAGGFGKTSLAVALCHDDRVLDAYSDGILWVTLGERPDVKGALTKLYAGLTAERPDFVDAEDAGNGLAEKLEGKDCLVVLDDVWNPSHLQPFEKALQSCGCLITTRIGEVAQRAAQVDVDQMSSDEAVEMLIRKLDPRPEDDGPFRSLAARMGEWPLLLELAGAALLEQTHLGESVEGAVAYLNQAMDELGIEAFDRDNPQQRKDAVSLTVAVSLKFLLQEEIDRFRQLAVFPEDVEVPLEVVGELWGTTNVQTRRLAQRLANLSLLDRLDYQSKTLRLHDVMRDYLSSRLDDIAGVHRKLLDCWQDLYRMPHEYAWRWIGYHMRGANRSDRLRELLLDADWLKAKLEATDVAELIADYDLVTEDPTLALVQGALRLSGHVLAREKGQLASQLYGRLLSLEEPELVRLREQFLRARGAWLRSLKPNLTPPGGSELSTLEGYGGWVTALAVTPDGGRVISGSLDKTLKVWDLQSGAVIATFTADYPIWSCAVAPDGITIGAGDQGGRVHFLRLEGV